MIIWGIFQQILSFSANGWLLARSQGNQEILLTALRASDGAPGDIQLLGGACRHAGDTQRGPPNYRLVHKPR
jgi:UPF0716 family protein affecting phage T7 exclusion